VLRISRFGVPNHDDWKFGFLGKVPYTLPYHRMKQVLDTPIKNGGALLPEAAEEEYEMR
jgi:hypothetical protein